MPKIVWRAAIRCFGGIHGYGWSPLCIGVVDTSSEAVAGGGKSPLRKKPRFPKYDLPPRDEHSGVALATGYICALSGAFSDRCSD